jgi:REP element-mobilizing transposase RayT
MSFTNMWAHLVWATKDRKPLLTKPARQEIFKHIRETAHSKGIYVDFINGYIDHVHCLISMNAKQNIADIAQALKGESSYWVNYNTTLLPHRLQWGKGYYAVSVGLSALDVVREYIKNQEAHHSKKSFVEECEEFMRIYGFDELLG